MTTTAEVLEEGTKNNRWINENMKDLRDKYGGEFIAVENERVIADSEEQEEVIRKAEERADDPESVVITFIYESGTKILR